jgi:hypothetical protein
LLVDSKNALANCEKYAREKGFLVNTTSSDEKFEIHITASK